MLGGVLAPEIIVGGAQALDDAPCPQIGAADADDHQGPGIALNAPGRRLDAVELLPVILLGQAHPAGEVASGSIALLQVVVGDAQAGRQRRLIGQGR